MPLHHLAAIILRGLTILTDITDYQEGSPGYDSENSDKNQVGHDSGSGFGAGCDGLQ
jgi:hypothetical protein